MIKLFGVSVWIHSIFILVLGVLLLLYTFKGDTKEAFQATSTTSTSGSGSGVVFGPGASASGAAYDLTKCVPGSTNTLGSGLVLGDYDIAAYEVSDCPILLLQMNSLKEKATTYMSNFLSTSLQDVQAQLCSLNISYIQTGCNASNSTVTSGAQLSASLFGSFLGSSPPLDPAIVASNVIKGTMALNTNQIVTSAIVPASISVGSLIYLGEYPLNYTGEFLITNITSGSARSVITTYTANTKATLTDAPIFWSPPLGKSNMPVLRLSSRQVVNAELYNGQRYIYMQGGDLNLPEEVAAGSPLYFTNCSATVGPYIAEETPTVDRILIGQYSGSSGAQLAADGTYSEPNLLNAFMHKPIFPRAIPLSIKEVFQIENRDGLTQYLACAKYGATAATAAQINTAKQNGLKGRDTADTTIANCWGNKPSNISGLAAIPFSEEQIAGGSKRTVYNDTIGVSYVSRNDVPCRPGTFSYKGDCFVCPAGHFCPAGALNPTECPAGKYNSSMGMSSALSCARCPAGNTCPPGTDVPIPCPPGFFCEEGKNIAVCPTGTYNSNPSMTSIESCLTCPEGSYCPVDRSPPTLDCSLPYSGATKTVTCPPGTICPPRSSNYALCPAGKYKTTTGGGTVEYCSSCEPGKYSVAGTTSVAGCISCPAGYFCTGGVDKKPCTPGTYSLANASQCTKCIAHTYSTTAMATSDTTCLSCAEGSYSDAGETSCRKCPSGTYFAVLAAIMAGVNFRRIDANNTVPATVTRCYTCPTGTYNEESTPITLGPLTRILDNPNACTSCPAGTYNNMTGRISPSSCLPCPTGHYNTSPRSDSCTICPAGAYCPTRTTIFYCPAGKYSAATAATSSDTCKSCPLGTYSAAAAATCTSCPAGTYTTTPESVSIGDCILCDAGTYSSTTGASSPSTCKACPPGTTSAAGAFVCTICPAGYYMENGRCTQCPVGHYCIGISQKIACPAGTFNSTPGGSSPTSCTVCGPETYSSATAATSSATCTACPTGTFSSTSGATSSATCIPGCIAGTYNSNPDASSPATCTKCPAGTFSSVVNATSSATCEMCPAGTYSTATGAISSATCTSCGPGTYSSATGANSPATCASCPAGTYSTATGATSSATCTACPPGTYSPINSATSSATCSACPPGTYSPNSSATSPATCQYCPLGTYSLTHGANSSTTCQICPKGAFCPTQALIFYCRPGTYSTLTGVTQNPCDFQLCPSGTYSTVTGATSADTCQPCPAGKTSIMGASSCS